jgi:hypothetical protein
MVREMVRLKKGKRLTVCEEVEGCEVLKVTCSKVEGCFEGKFFVGPVFWQVGKWK